MAHSYSYLCKKAGVPVPGENICRPMKVFRRIVTESQKKEWLSKQLDQMVADGMLYKTTDGKFGLKEWVTNPETSSS